MAAEVGLTPSQLSPFSASFFENFFDMTDKENVATQFSEPDAQEIADWIISRKKIISDIHEAIGSDPNSTDHDSLVSDIRSVYERKEELEKQVVSLLSKCVDINQDRWDLSQELNEAKRRIQELENNGQ